jgi:hypothetical protein
MIKIYDYAPGDLDLSHDVSRAGMLQKELQAVEMTRSIFDRERAARVEL